MMKPLVVSVVILLLPLGAAAGAYSAEGTFGTTLAGALAQTDSYSFHADAGDVITASVAHAETEGRVVLSLIPVASPIPCRSLVVACVGIGSADVPATCDGGDYASGALEGASLSVSLTAPVSGAYKVNVESQLVATTLTYHLAIAVDGEAPTGVTIAREEGLLAVTYAEACTLL